MGALPVFTQGNASFPDISTDFEPNLTLQTDIDASEAIQLLRFYVEAGVTDGLDDAPVDRYALLPQQMAPAVTTTVEERSSQRITGTVPEPSRRSPVARPPLPASPSPAGHSPAAIPLSSVEEAGAARALAGAATSLDALREALASFDACPLKATAKSLVFADGNPEADIMLVGEAPGRDEDIQGLPFVGRAGQLLNKMLSAIGYDRSNVYITNVLPWRPPGNRQPTPQELLMCAPFVERHIELVQPKLLMLVGGVSAKQLLTTSDGIMKLRGKWKTVTVGSLEIPAMPILHPAYLLRQPAHKKLAWTDLQAFRDKARSLS